MVVSSLLSKCSGPWRIWGMTVSPYPWIKHTVRNRHGYVGMKRDNRRYSRLCGTDVKLLHSDVPRELLKSCRKDRPFKSNSLSSHPGVSETKSGNGKHLTWDKNRVQRHQQEDSIYPPWFGTLIQRALYIYIYNDNTRVIKNTRQKFVVDSISHENQTNIFARNKTNLTPTLSNSNRPCPWIKPTNTMVPIMTNEIKDNCLPRRSIFFCKGVRGAYLGKEGETDK